MEIEERKIKRNSENTDPHANTINTHTSTHTHTHTHVRVCVYDVTADADVQVFTFYKEINQCSFSLRKPKCVGHYLCS